MTLVVERFGDVTRLRMSSAGSRAVSLDVSAYIFRGIMVDTGFPRVRQELAEAVRSLDVQCAIVTHWHEDHAGNVPMLAESRVPMLLRADTEAILRACPDIQLYRRAVWGRPEALTTSISAFEPGAIDRIHTPGHSTDHQVVWDRESGTLFSGDLWLGIRARIFHASEDPYQIVESLRAIRALSPARMFDAHRGPVERPIAAIDAKISWLSDTIGTIERRVAEGWNDARIVKQILDGEEIAALLSRGEYARRNLVRAIRSRLRTRDGEPPSSSHASRRDA